MDFVVVVLMGGARISYERGSTFLTGDPWLTVYGKAGSPVAAFPDHRIARVYYASDVHDNVGNSATQSVGL